MSQSSSALQKPSVHCSSSTSKMILLTLLFVAATVSSQETTCNEPCFVPKYQDIPLYLPFCYQDQTFNNVCEAKCKASETQGFPTKGSCNGCEKQCRNKPFVPKCTADQRLVFPTQCHANCAQIEVVDCKLRFQTVIPGKTKLPPGREPPIGLQNLR